MTQQSALVQTWLSGADIDNLAVLLEREPKQIEGLLRDELVRIGREHAGNGVKPAPKPAPVAPRPPAAAKRRHPNQKTPAFGKALKGETPKVQGEFDAYPEWLRHPLATMQRKVYDVLKVKPHTLSGICEEMGLQPEDCRLVSSALFNMRRNAHVENEGGVWRLV